MYQKDFIMRMIEQLGTVLAALLGFREKGENEKALLLIDETLTTHFDLNVDQLLAIPEEDFLVEVTMVTREESALNMMAEMLYQYGLFVKDDNSARALDSISRALLIFYYLDAESITYDIVLQDKFDAIDKLIKELES